MHIYKTLSFYLPIALLYIFYNNIISAHQELNSLYNKKTISNISIKQEILKKINQYKLENQNHIYYCIQQNKKQIFGFDKYCKVKYTGKNMGINNYISYINNINKYNNINNNLGKILGSNICIGDYDLLKKIYFEFKIILDVNILFKNQYNDINKKMFHIQNILSSYERTIAEFYFKRRNYVATINRSKSIINNLDQSQSNYIILKMIINSYSAIGRNKEAKRFFLLLKRMCYKNKT